MGKLWVRVFESLKVPLELESDFSSIIAKLARKEFKINQ